MNPITMLDVDHTCLRLLKRNGFGTAEAVYAFYQKKGSFRSIKQVGEETDKKLVRACKKWSQFAGQLHFVHQAFENLLIAHDFFDVFDQKIRVETGLGFHGWLKVTDAMIQDPKKYTSVFKNVLPDWFAPIWHETYRKLNHSTE